MHIGIAKTVFDLALERLRQIHATGRKPEYIALTPQEFSDLRDDYRADRHFDRGAGYLIEDKAMASETFKVRRFPVKRRGMHGPDHYVVMESGVFQGVPVFVVPDHCDLVSL